jgi:putative inorganic carbon (HCO3(-)) transporter
MEGRRQAERCSYRRNGAAAHNKPTMIARVLDPRLPPLALPAVAGVAIGLIAAAAATTASLVSILAVVLILAAVAAALLGARRLFIAAVVLDIPLMWDINLFYRGDEPYPGGLNVSITTLALAGLYALWIARALAGRRPAPPLRLHEAIAALVYVGLTTLSVAVAEDRTLALFGTLLLVQSLLVFLYFSSTLSRADLWFVISALALGVILESVAVIASYYVGHDFAFAGVAGHGYEAEPGSLYRPGGTIGSPNVAGSFLGIVLVPVLMLLVSPVSRGVRLLAGAAFPLGLVALVLTGSRGGWLAFAVALVVMGLAAANRGLLPPSAALGGLVLTGLVAILLGDIVVTRLTGDDGGAAASRIPLMEIAWEMIQDNTYLGVGVNNFSVVLPDFAGPRFTGAWLAIVHNQYLLIWAEAGVVALLAFLVFLATTIRRAWEAAQTRDPQLAPLAVGCLAALLGALPNLFVERFVNRPQIGLLWLLAALVVVLHVEARRAERRPGGAAMGR